MPNFTIYIRKSDVDKWKAIENKSEWLSKKLDEDVMIVDPTPKEKQNKVLPPIQVDATSPDVKSTSQPVLKPKSNNVCKNGHPIPDGYSRCLGKGCKYS